MNRALLTLAPITLGAALLAGCSPEGDADPSHPAGASAADAAAADGVSALSKVVGESETVEESGSEPQALIKRGTVVLRADDVGAARAEVQQVTDRYAGQVSSEKTQSDDDGRPTYTRMVLRVPAADFAEAVEALKGAGELEEASTDEDDVTGEVIDVRTRLRVQHRSIARITVLFDRAESIRDIMAIEAQLSQRQAELESLQRQADHLANQTSLSTIVVTIDRTAKSTTEEGDDTGFVAGLGAGWGALTAVAVGLATAAGIALPWLVVVAVAGVPALLLTRALRRRTSAATVAAPAEGQSSE